MHEGGELDIRGAFVLPSQQTCHAKAIKIQLIIGAYCAAVVANILNISTEPLFDRTPQWIVRL